MSNVKKSFSFQFFSNSSQEILHPTIFRLIPILSAPQHQKAKIDQIKTLKMKFIPSDLYIFVCQKQIFREFRAVLHLTRKILLPIPTNFHGFSEKSVGAFVYLINEFHFFLMNLSAFF